MTDDKLEELHQKYSSYVDNIASNLMPALTKNEGSNCPILAEWIGGPWDPNVEVVRNYIVDVTKPWVRDIIDALNGPHGATILKVLEIKHKERQNGE